MGKWCLVVIEILFYVDFYFLSHKVDALTLNWSRSQLSLVSFFPFFLLFLIFFSLSSPFDLIFIPRLFDLFTGALWGFLIYKVDAHTLIGQCHNRLLFPFFSSFFPFSLPFLIFFSLSSPFGLIFIPRLFDLFTGALWPSS